MRSLVRTVFLLVAFHLSTGVGSALAQSPAIYQSSASFLGSKYAVGGYDTVAYHIEKKAVAGVDQFTHTWKGATWRFASQANLDAFVKAPEMFAPQYGGYCAFAVGHNSLASGDPKIWRIFNGKLYLNLSEFRADELGTR